MIDALVAQGAEFLLIPTLDELSWGEQEHRHHERVAPIRAAEYGVPILRVGANGISQIVNAGGAVAASTEYPGLGATIHGALYSRADPKLPLDAYVAPVLSALTGLALATFTVGGAGSALFFRRRKKS